MYGNSLEYCMPLVTHDPFVLAGKDCIRCYEHRTPICNPETWSV